MKYSLSIILLFWGLIGFAQQSMIQNAAIFNPYSFNPARAGDSISHRFFLNMQRRIGSAPTSPASAWLSYDSRLANGRSGIGIQVYNENISIFNHSGVNATYAYRIPANEKHEYGFGFSVGMMNRQVNSKAIMAKDENDYLLTTPDLNKNRMNFAIGYTSKHRWTGQKGGKSMISVDLATQQMLLDSARNVWHNIPYVFNLRWQMQSRNQVWKYEPLLGLRVYGRSIMLEYAGVFNYKEYLIFGGGYRQVFSGIKPKGDSYYKAWSGINGFAAFRIPNMEGLMISLAYNAGSAYSAGTSIEAGLTFTIPKKEQKRMDTLEKKIDRVRDDIALKLESQDTTIQTMKRNIAIADSIATIAMYRSDKLDSLQSEKVRLAEIQDRISTELKSKYFSVTEITTKEGRPAIIFTFPENRNNGNNLFTFQGDLESTSIKVVDIAYKALQDEKTHRKMNMQIQVYSSGNMGDDAYQITNKVAENIQKRIEERVNAGFDKKRISYSAKEDLFPFVPAKHEAENKRLVLIFYFD